MRGREKFEKYSCVLSLLEKLILLFPRGIREKLFIHFRGLKGTAGLALRYVLIRTLAKEVGDNVSIHPNVYLFKLNQMTIGDNVSIHPMCYFDAAGGIDIGNNVSIAHDVSIISFNHKFSDHSIPIKDQGLIKKPIIIHDDVWVGAKSMILAGVVVNSGSIIGAGSVVTHNIEENTIVAGVPAKVIKYR